MADQSMEVPHQAAAKGSHIQTADNSLGATNCEIPLDVSPGLELSCCNLSQNSQNCNLTSDTAAAAQLQPPVSRQGYRQLFFDCNLHLVLKQLLSKHRGGGSNRGTAVSSDAALETQCDTEAAELTDTEVARLMRQHLNILVSSQSATEAEVVNAAKALEQRFLQPAADAPPALETKEQKTGTRSDSDSHIPAATIDPEGVALKAPQADGKRMGVLQTHTSAYTPESQENSDAEHNITGLPLSQTQEAQRTEPDTSSASLQGLADGSSFSTFQDEVKDAKTTGGDEKPRKKLCREVPHRV